MNKCEGSAPDTAADCGREIVIDLLLLLPKSHHSWNVKVEVITNTTNGNVNLNNVKLAFNDSLLKENSKQF